MLLVEDSRALARNWRVLLEAAGHRVTVAPTVAQAADALVEAPPGAIRVVLLDLQLPDGDGSELLPIIDRLAPRPLVAVVSAHYDSVRAVELCGRCAAALPKPVSARLLRALVDRLVRVTEPGRVEAYCREHGLNATEKAMVAGLAAGLDSRALAAELGCARGTLSTHWHRIFTKTGTRSREQVLAGLLRRALGSLQ